jgi:hypothetical protein
MSEMWISPRYPGTNHLLTLADERNIYLEENR